MLFRGRSRTLYRPPLERNPCARLQLPAHDVRLVQHGLRPRPVFVMVPILFSSRVDRQCLVGCCRTTELDFYGGTATIFAGISWNERRGAVGVSFYLMEQNISVAVMTVKYKVTVNKCAAGGG